MRRGAEARCGLWIRERKRNEEEVLDRDAEGSVRERGWSDVCVPKEE